MRKLILIIFITVAITSCNKDKDPTLEVNGYEIAGTWVSDSSRTTYYYDDSITLNEAVYDTFPDHYSLYDITNTSMMHIWYNDSVQSGGDSHPREIELVEDGIQKDGWIGEDPIVIQVVFISSSNMTLLYQDAVNDNFTTNQYMYLHRVN